MGQDGMDAFDPDFAASWARHECYEADWITGDPETLRRAYRRARAALAGDVHPEVRTRPVAVGALRGLVFRPERPAAGDAVIYFHGGSWVVGAPETHLVPCSWLAAESGLPVWSVDYRLAPEHRFPAQREDGVGAVSAVLGQVPGQVVLAGDSAGAAVAFWTEAALSITARARIAGVACLYGAYGRLPEGSDGADDGSGLGDAALSAAYRRLGPLERLGREPGFDIIQSIGAEGPPCHLGCGTADPLLDDTEALGRRLGSLGRPVDLALFPGLGHSYLHHAGAVPAAREALRQTARWIAAAVA